MLVAIHPWDCAGAKEVLLNILQQTWHGGTVEDRRISQQHVYHRHVDAPEFFGASSRYLLWGTVWHFHYWHGAGVIWHGPCMGHLTTRVNAGGIESSINRDGTPYPGFFALPDAEFTSFENLANALCKWEKVQSGNMYLRPNLSRRWEQVQLDIVATLRRILTRRDGNYIFTNYIAAE